MSARIFQTAIRLLVVIAAGAVLGGQSPEAGRGLYRATAGGAESSAAPQATEITTSRSLITVIGTSHWST